MPIIKLNQLKAGDTYEGTLLIRNVRIGVTSGANQSSYLSFDLSDNTSTVDAKLWDATKEQIDAFRSGMLVNIAASVKLYNNHNQLVLNSIQANNEPLDMVEFIESPVTIPLEDLEGRIVAVVNNMQNQTLKTITMNIYMKYRQSFINFPAAKLMHHAYHRGLIFHTYSMLGSANALASNYPDVNRDLLFAGVILHDIAKVREYASTVDTTITPIGALIGHISLMYGEIVREAAILGLDESDESVLTLSHVVLAHHGQLEWGSPVKPIMREAVILHLIDNVDAKMDSMSSAMTDTIAGTLTEPIFRQAPSGYYKTTL